MGTESISHRSSFKRTPLMELSANTPPHKRFKPGFESSRVGMCIPAPDFSLDKEVSADDRVSSDPFVTPLKDESVRVSLSYGGGCSTSSLLDDEIDDSILEEIDAICEQSVRKAACQTPNTSMTETPSRDYQSSSSLLDDDIDDSVLEEIDAICEESARKIACQTPSTTSMTQTPSKDNKSSDLEGGLDSRGVKMFKPDSNVKLEFNKETSVAADPALITSMPEECSKYMQSLNDRQRDAACSDISTPLMVIAGPGSGKVSI